jgi:hypothetical protein
VAVLVALTERDRLGELLTLDLETLALALVH